jgi:hypothetical protein
MIRWFRVVGRSENLERQMWWALSAPPPPSLCVEMGFYEDISWESRCNIEINVWVYFYKLLLVFGSTLSTPSQNVAWKKLKLPHIAKGYLKLSFYSCFTHWCNCLCETEWLGVGKDIKETLKFYENDLRLWFHCYFLIPRKCPLKTLFHHIVGGGPLLNQLTDLLKSPCPRFLRPWIGKATNSPRGIIVWQEDM